MAARSKEQVKPITEEQAKLIEMDCGLPIGSVAANREMTAAEATYLSLAPLTPFAFHLEVLPGYTHLVILDLPEIARESMYPPGTEDTDRDQGGKSDSAPGGHEQSWDPFLEKPEQSASKGQLQIIQNWAAVTATREGGLLDVLGENLMLSITGSTQFEGRRHSSTYSGSCIRGVFAQSPRGLLMEPEFAELPPENDGEKSPGLYIKGTRIGKVVKAHSILFQGTRTYQNHDAAGIYRLTQLELSRSIHG